MLLWKSVTLIYTRRLRISKDNHCLCEIGTVMWWTVTFNTSITIFPNIAASINNVNSLS